MTFVYTRFLPSLSISTVSAYRTECVLDFGASTQVGDCGLKVGPSSDGRIGVRMHDRHKVEEALEALSLGFSIRQAAELVGPRPRRSRPGRAGGSRTSGALESGRREPGGRRPR